jgi:hypothetical protein
MINFFKKINKNPTFEDDIGKKNQVPTKYHNAYLKSQ